MTKPKTPARTGTRTTSVKADTYKHPKSGRTYQPTVETVGMLTRKERTPQPFTISHQPNPYPAEEAMTDWKQEPKPRLAWDRNKPSSINDQPTHFTGSLLYTREKVHPLNMINQLKQPHTPPAQSLFDDFNGLPENAKKWEFYEHTGHWQNRLIHGDNSPAMQSLIARDGLGGQVQTIIFDPPYGIQFNSNFMTATDKTTTTHNASGVPVGDTQPVKAYKDTYDRDIHSYLDEIHERLLLFRELLSDTGSLFVQIGDDNVHRLALLLDEVFHPDNRIATITYQPSLGASARLLAETGSYLLWYAKNKEQVKYHQLYEPLTQKESVDSMVGYGRVELADGSTRPLTKEERSSPETFLPEGSRVYLWKPLVSNGVSPTRTCWFEFEGVRYHPGATKQWSVSAPSEQTRLNEAGEPANGAVSPSDDDETHQISGLERLAQLGRLEGTGNEGSGLYYKKYEDEIPGRKITNVWHRRMAPSRKRYVVQTSDSVLERCLLMSSDPGDLILDATAGSGSTLCVAEKWGRRWIGIDVSMVAIAVARRHLITATYDWYKTRDGGTDPSAGFKTETMQRVSAATLAYNTVKNPKKTIHLVDRPHKNLKRFRLTGPFTVESSSPYNYLPLTNPETPENGNNENGLEVKPDVIEARGKNAERLLEALRIIPVTDASGKEALHIGEITPLKPNKNVLLVTYRAECALPGRETRFDAAVMLAEPDINVTSDMVAQAVAETVRWNRDTEHLIIVAGSFENATSEEAGPVQVYKINTSRDIQLPGLSPKKTDTGSLTLLGEPDIVCDWNDEGLLVVEVLGYDTYDPVTGHTEHSSGENLDCWMIDTNHDGTGFFPRLVYLPAYTRESPEIRKLLKKLGKDLNPDAEKALCGYTSQPFPPPQLGHNVAVKIITRTGAEMTVPVELPPPHIK